VAREPEQGLGLEQGLAQELELELARREN